MNEYRRSYTWEILKGLSMNKLSRYYSEMRIFLNISAKKKHKFTQSDFQQRIKKLDEYQQDLKTLSEMHITSDGESFNLKGYLIREWAIQKYHNFAEQRKKYGI